MTTSKLLIEYDGTDFFGWARQPGLRTVQEELERALAVVARRPVALTVAGRTDRGVHASGQVASYAGEPVRLDSVNALLPDDVAVRAITEAEDGFDARRSAASRTYRYRVLQRRARTALDRRFVLHWPGALDRDALHDCAALLPGTHDFTAFTPAETYHVRFDRIVSRAEWREDGDRLSFWIEADAFMRAMNRILVGTMLEVAQGKRTLEEFAALLEGAHRRDAGITAPPHGLTLTGVAYPQQGGAASPSVGPRSHDRP
jgi:tRNA pseudouridine38-40 synthase